MTRFLALSTALTVLASPVMAQSHEQQVYYPPYMAPTAITQQDLVNRQNYIIAQEQARLENDGPYIERDPTASYRGRIPMHPGDYRDALDRGELPNIGTSYKTNTPPGH